MNRTTRLAKTGRTYVVALNLTDVRDRTPSSRPARVDRWLGVLLLVVLGASVVGGASASASTPSQAGSFPGCELLLEGQTSPCVERLQTNLNIVNGDYALPVTGFFGPRTRTAVLDFQGRNKLPADGNVGTVTAEALMARVKQIQASQEPATQDPPVQQPKSHAEQCRELGESMGGKFLLPGDPGQCVPDGVGTTKSGSQCVAELAGKEYAKALKKKLQEGKPQEQAEREARDAADKKKAEANREVPKAEGSKKLSWKTAKAVAKRGATIASLYKCMFFDKAPYPSYPLPR